MKNVISLGVGVQSSTLCLMGEQGLLGEKPDCAVFADTMGEPESVYTYLKFLEEAVSFPIHRVAYRDLGADTLRKAHGQRPYSGGSPPLFYKKPNGKMGMGARQCTRDYKIKPVHMFVKTEVLGLKRLGRWPETPQANIWIGITTDEIERMKACPRPALVNTFPFINTVPMSREDCKDWLADNGFPIPPKSACWFCPYADDLRWAFLKHYEPEAFERAVEFDRDLRTSEVSAWSEPAYLHVSGVPLGDVPLPDASEADDRSFLGECDGMCGI